MKYLIIEQSRKKISSCFIKLIMFKVSAFYNIKIIFIDFVKFLALNISDVFSSHLESSLFQKFKKRRFEKSLTC